jgi:hypothetical protein
VGGCDCVASCCEWEQTTREGGYLDYPQHAQNGPRTPRVRASERIRQSRRQKCRSVVRSVIIITHPHHHSPCLWQEVQDCVLYSQGGASPMLSPLVCTLVMPFDLFLSLSFFVN